MIRVDNASLLTCGTFLALASMRAVAAEPAPVLEEILVTADRTESFSADYVQAGTFRNARLIETPMTVAVFTKEMLETQQALTLGDTVRNTAGVSASQINSVIYSNLTIRGIAANNFTNYRLNGVLPIVNLIDMPLENKSRVEVLKGASGLYYGFATPAGIVNLTTERPGTEPITDARVIANGYGTVGADVDFSRHWGQSGLRLNAAATRLENGIDNTEGDRYLVAAAYDWHPTERLVLELDVEYIDKSITEPTEFALPAPVNGVITLPPLQDSSKNLGARWFKADGEEFNWLTQARYRFSSAWSASVSVGQSLLSRTRRYSSFNSYNLASGDGTVTVLVTPGNDYDSSIVRTDIAGAFQTGPIEHEILIGAAEAQLESFVPTAARYTFAQNLYRPVDLPERPDPARAIANPAENRDRGYYVTDRARIGEWLQLTAGYRWTDYRNVSRTSNYEATPESLSYSAMVRPKPWISIYGSYIEGLEEGGRAQSIAVNAGAILPPAMSEQREAGIKLEPTRGLLVTAAWFDIERASSYLNASNVFVQDGRARYEGIEVSVAGEITSNLSVLASALYNDAIQESGAAMVVGKRIENAPKYSGSLFLKYELPASSGLELTAGAFHTGKRAVNAANNAFAPGYTTYDFGANYASTLAGHPVTYRLHGENITGLEYWAATGSGLLAQGVPRVIKFSLSAEF
jgi:iron complex outermembrane receptor protein